MSGNARRAPLEGLKVLDLTHGVAGPYCTMVLGDLGCDVIKIEKPDRGDSTRYMNVSERFHTRIPQAGGDYFLAINRNKRSLGLELKTVEGQAIARELAAAADIVVQNFRPGVTKRLGLDYESLRGTNPRLIYANISAYGTTGTLAAKPGMDVAVQARSGIMRITGEHGSTQPLRPGASIADFGGGIYLTTAVVTALYDRERTGKGQEISVSLLDAMMSLLINYSVAVMDGKAQVAPLGSGHPQLVPYQAFPTEDGFVVIGAGTNKVYRELCQALRRPELAVDPSFLSNQDRVRNRERLIPILSELTRTYSTEAILDLLDAADVPCAPVHDLPSAYRDLAKSSPEMVQTVRHSELGDIHQLGVPFKFADCAGSIRRPPPVLGEHTEQILKELGRDQRSIDELRGRKII